MIESSDINLLVALDALLQEGSVTRAAKRVGLSTPAMSHALARIRERIGDPILVRAGRGMLLTPRAEGLREQVRSVVEGARRALEPAKPLVPAEMTRAFTVHASDYVLTVLGFAVDRMLRAQAPSVSMRFVPNALDDPAQLREGGADLTVGIYGDLPQEMRSKLLLTDRFVCVVREGHPKVGKRLSLEEYVSLPHIQIAPRGRPGGYIDDVLSAKGFGRRVVRAIPFFLTAMQMVAHTDDVLTVSERLAKRLAKGLGLRVFEVPLELRPYGLSLVWHPRFDGDAEHRFLRNIFVQAAAEEASDSHRNPRTKLDATDPASGQTRKRHKRTS